MKARHIVKGAVKMIINADGNLITLIIRTSKDQVFKILDVLIPDDPEPEKITTRFDLRADK